MTRPTHPTEAQVAKALSTIREALIVLKRMRQFYLYKDMSDEQWSINGRACGRLWVYLPDEVSSIIVTYDGHGVPHPRYQHQPPKPFKGEKM